MGMKRAASRAEKRRFWEDHLGKLEASGLSQAEYCRRNNLALKNLGYWKRRIKSRNPSVSFVELPALRQLPSSLFPISSPLSLVIGGRFRVEIQRGFEHDTLEELIRTLERL
jgi:hypothetical protein